MLRSVVRTSTRAVNIITPTSTTYRCLSAATATPTPAAAATPAAPTLSDEEWGKLARKVYGQLPRKQMEKKVAELKASKKPEETVAQLKAKLWLRSAGHGVEAMETKLPKSLDEIYKMRRLHFKDAGVPARQRRRILTRQYYDRIEYLMRTGQYNPVLDLTKLKEMVEIKPANWNA